MDRSELENFGSLITIKGTDECLGDLMHFGNQGTYDPSYGLVPVTEAEAAIHNKALDAARLEGMDRNCEIGQGSFAYFVGDKVTTFLGSLVSDKFTLSGNINKTIKFQRAGKVYKGRLSRYADAAFNFRRIQ
jgi:hypothetical protein